MNLGKHSAMIIFETLLTAFKVNSIFEEAETVAEIGLSLKPNHHNQVKLLQIPDQRCRNLYFVNLYLVIEITSSSSFFLSELVN